MNPAGVPETPAACPEPGGTGYPGRDAAMPALRGEGHRRRSLEGFPLPGICSRVTARRSARGQARACGGGECLVPLLTLGIGGGPGARLERNAQRGGPDVLSGVLRARRLASPPVTEQGHRVPADRRPVIEAADHGLNVSEAQVGALKPHLDQECLDLIGVAFQCSLSLTCGLNFGQKVFNHVCHVPIIADLRSRLQVIVQIMIARTAICRAWSA
jgi:hypothetical protein